jgi:hemoglobin-like flavoprotein
MRFNYVIRFFTENPSYQQYFKSFKDIPISELRGNKKVLAPETNVMYAISMRVYNIQDTEVLAELLKKLAESHYKRKITIEKFENLKISLIGLLKEKLGPKLMNDKAVAALG